MRPQKNPVVRGVLIIVGCVSLLLGVAGIFLPLLPTTPFVLLTAWCFYQSSETFHNWLVRHPTFAPIINDWQERRAISRRSKVVALGMLMISLIGLHVSSVGLGVKVAVTVFLIAVATFIVTRPE